MPTSSIEEIEQLLRAGRLTELTADRVELKSSWRQDYGKDISALANCTDNEPGWLVVGVDDSGTISGKDYGWLQKTEHEIANHINQMLAPVWAATVFTRQYDNGCCIFIFIKNPGEVTDWNGKAYKLSGTSSQPMSPEERISLTLKLPGEDFSKTPDLSPTNSSLVMEFAEKVKEAHPGEFPEDLSALSSTDVLRRLKIFQTATAAILFGRYPVRIAYLDKDDEILSQETKRGAYSVLSDAFIETIQNWTRTQATSLRGNTTATSTEIPYPLKALREVLANAVAHAMYHRSEGDILIELRPKRISVSNSCGKEARAFSKKWFARETHANNKLLMQSLRSAQIADELGSGKSRVFRLMVESGKREPIIEFSEFEFGAKWSITLYNELENLPLLELVSRFRETFTDSEKARIATALVLWRNRSWSEVVSRLDEHFQRVAVEVIQSAESPVFVIGEEIFPRRWVNVALTGQMSRRFTQIEEKQIKTALQRAAFENNRQGYITSELARQLIGLSNTQSETVQLSNLFKKWKDAGEIQMVKRGQWKFLSESEKQTKVIMTILDRFTKQIIEQ
ncbi:MAG TPA: hypothetical protein DCS07_00805 [Bdellovibrionales bacterium]|nr:MAG: hypothetical protein A2Z97_04125 [Bdellovibrionales bacterium GWB1_52_6]OFZ02422.1 MAG: hypothetical protein A2X97_12800 [Bdellovibrionales bacterium GWA1_52_35]OFZ34352.1 MAG: hypothetical protein A2070_03035 [Bdellovibrionales bacterium GWC1_52_8]HAR41169.1 hypothetical protein [Bdellovibrionales bacterium]HCM41549.1 hypothetical protein [Bdellovibrionales bacterium]